MLTCRILRVREARTGIHELSKYSYLWNDLRKEPWSHMPGLVCCLTFDCE